MTNEEKEAKGKLGYDEKIDFNEIDKKVGLGNILKDNRYMKYLKNVLFVLLPVVIGLTFFGVSFKIGEKIFFVYQTTVKDSLQKNVTQNGKEVPDVAVVSKADEPVAGEVKSGVKTSASVRIVEPASGQVEKVSNPVMEKNMVQPVQKIVAPGAKTERPVAAAKPEETVPVVKPDANGSLLSQEKRKAVNPAKDVQSVDQGRSQLNAGEFAAAVDTFTRIIAAHPKDSLSYRLRGNAYDNLGDRQKAVEDWTQAAELGDTTLLSYLEFLQVKGPENPAPAHPKGVRVIGNRDSKRYHLPGMKYYDLVKAYHRVVFPSEKEAIRAGYHRARE